VARIREVGERALLLEVDRPAAAAAWLRAGAGDRGLAVADVVPAARTVLVTVASRSAVPALRGLLGALPADLADFEPQRNDPVDIAVRFDGPDLTAVAEHAGVAPDAVVRLLLDADLVVQFCGFSPGFAYLTGLPAPLRIPRRPEPRVRVPAGAFALADEFAAVYPRESPGGWNLVGTTDQVMFDIDRDPPALLVAGTRVRLREVP
jgi:KipI family sensor histidine kinase inhibitor